jgi:signal transduction histidine kinase
MNPDGSVAAQQRILLLEPSRAAAMEAERMLREAVPSAEVVKAECIEGYQKALGENDFDLVILDYDLPEVQAAGFIKSLALRDNEPKVVLVSRCADSSTVRSLSEARRTWILRDEHWIESLKCAVRDTLRIRKLEQERVLLRAQLTETNRMLEERNRRLDEFSSTVAHDIRGPLGGLMLKIDYILDVYKGQFDEKCTKLLERSLGSAERVVGIVQAMYEYAKIGAKATRHELVNLEKLVLDVLADLNLNESKTVDVGVDTLPNVWGDEALLRRVFINLIGNAIKYSDKPEVRLNVGYAGSVKRSIGRFAQIFVEDNGPGIPKDDAENIFNMFRRGSGREGTTEGLGVGLAVVQKIVQLHYGQIELETSPGCGCRFVFSLPEEKIALGAE